VEEGVEEDDRAEALAVGEADEEDQDNVRGVVPMRMLLMPTKKVKGSEMRLRGVVVVAVEDVVEEEEEATTIAATSWIMPLHGSPVVVSLSKPNRISVKMEST
jgi:hypothetical protein